MRVLLIASVLVLAGCGTIEGWFGDDQPAPKASEGAATAPTGEKVGITKATWAAYENYKYWLTPETWNGSLGQGYFAVAKDGRSWGLTGCPVRECVAGSPISQDAIDICHTRSGGVPCSIFAKDQEIIVPYEIIQ